MKLWISTLAAGAAALAIAGPAPAQQREVGYPEGSLGFQAIMSADYAAAEQQLQDFRVDKQDPGRLINLSVVLAKTGRTGAAAAYLEEVLRQDAVELILADGRTMLSHDIARAALRGLASSR